MGPGRKLFLGLDSPEGGGRLAHPGHSPPGQLPLLLGALDEDMRVRHGPTAVLLQIVGIVSDLKKSDFYPTVRWPVRERCQRFCFEVWAVCVCFVAVCWQRMFCGRVCCGLTVNSMSQLAVSLHHHACFDMPVVMQTRHPLPYPLSLRLSPFPPLCLTSYAMTHHVQVCACSPACACESYGCLSFTFCDFAST